MESHPTGDEIRQFHSKTLSPQRLLSISSHLKACSACRERIAALAGSSGGNDHLTYEMKERYLDGDMTAAESSILDAHIRVCGRCKREVDHLRGFTDMLSDTPPDDIDR